MTKTLEDINQKLEEYVENHCAGVLAMLIDDDKLLVDGCCLPADLLTIAKIASQAATGGEGEQAMNQCDLPDCNEPRFIADDGNDYYHYCLEHQMMLDAEGGGMKTDIYNQDKSTFRICLSIPRLFVRVLYLRIKV